MASDPLTGFDFDEAAGTMNTAAQKAADDHLLVQFFLHPQVDILLTEGGELPKNHPRVKELRQREAERLDILRKARPFEEPAPEHPGKDAPEAAKQLYAEKHAEWEAARVRHDDDLKLEATILAEHPENPKLYVVAPAGRPVYTEREFIRIIKPGDRDSVLEVPLDKDYKLRFAARYQQWKENNGGEGAIGTPLREVPFINSALREEMAFFGIHTAEQLVNLADNVKQHFMGINALQQRVQLWLGGTSGNAAIEKLTRESQAKDAELRALQEAVASLQQQLAGGKPGSTNVNATVERLAAEAKRR